MKYAHDDFTDGTAVTIVPKPEPEVMGWTTPGLQNPMITWTVAVPMKAVEQSALLPVVDLLRAGRALISDRRNWCQLAMSKIKSMPKKRNIFATVVTMLLPLDSDYENVTQYCTMGALSKVAFGHADSIMHHTSLNETLSRAIGLLSGAAGGYGQIASFNDENSHRAVLRMWDRAIRAAELD